MDGQPNSRPRVVHVRSFTYQVSAESLGGGQNPKNVPLAVGEGALASQVFASSQASIFDTNKQYLPRALAAHIEQQKGLPRQQQ